VLASSRRLLAVLVLIALLAGLPAYVLGVARVASATVATVGPYECDDTTSTARPLPLGAPWAGTLSTQLRALEATTAASGDQDWLYIDVNEVAAASYSYVIEARNVTASAPDPVIEVYGPSPDFSPSDPSTLASDTVSLTDAAVPDSGCVAANDQGSWFRGYPSSVSFVPSRPGRYYVRIRSRVRSAGASSGAYVLRAKIGQTTRVGGVDAISTAAAISRERYANGGLRGRTVLLGTTTRPMSVLAGSTLGGAIDAPILLTATSGLSTAARMEITRLGVTQVLLLGGRGAVGSRVIADLYRYFPSVGVRSAMGSDEAGTAYAIAKVAAARLRNSGGTAKTAFVVGTTSAEDALVCSSMAAANAAPLLLTSRDTLSAATLTALRDPVLGIKDVVIVGPTSHVGSAVETKLRTLKGSGHVRRIGATDRYAEARRFAYWATDVGGIDGRVGTTAAPAALRALDHARVALASGDRVGFAITAGPFAGKASAPILLTPSTRLSPWVYDVANVLPDDALDYRSLSPAAILRSYVIGPTGAISEAVRVTFDVGTGS